MIFPIILLFLGLLLVFLEFFLPGAIMGIAGGILILLSIIFFAINTKSFLALIIFIIAAIILLILFIRFALWRLKKEKHGIYHSKDQEGYLAASYLKEMIGKQGEAVSDLKPAGHVIVEGKRVQAVSRGGYINKGTKIEVIGGEGGHLIVKTIEGNNT